MVADPAAPAHDALGLLARSASSRRSTAACWSLPLPARYRGVTAAAEASPRNHRLRFDPTRAGIINLWDYRDEEFSFADGWLVLRGPNGSGKTKALEVLFPFVLDGRIEPKRLNPFAGEDRTMKSNLLYRGQDSAARYVWMEFRARRDDRRGGHGRHRPARPPAPRQAHPLALRRRRPGRRGLLPAHRRRPAADQQAARRTDRRPSCRRRPPTTAPPIDARLFGLGAERYEQLLTLILTLRRPQLAKNLDPVSCPTRSPTACARSTTS